MQNLVHSQHFPPSLSDAYEAYKSIRSPDRRVNVYRVVRQLCDGAADSTGA